MNGVSRKRYLILAEEFSADPHYGKTLRGVMRYRREAVVAILDRKRAGESDDGVPIVATVKEAMRYEPDTALVGVVTQGGHFPADWRALLKSCVEAGLDVENIVVTSLRGTPVRVRDVGSVGIGAALRLGMLGRDQNDDVVGPATSWNDGQPETELNFKFYRQATNKIVGISDKTAAFLRGFF